VAWVKLDDKFRVHPKILALSPVAGWLWVCGLSYCNDHLTDGAIPSRGLPGVAPTIKNPLRYVEELVRVGLWTVAETGWLVHDYHQYQPTRSDAISDGALKTAAKVAGGLARSKFAERASGKFAKTHDTHQQSTSSAPAAAPAAPPAAPPAGHQQATSPVPVPVPVPEKKFPPKPPKGGALPPGFEEFWRRYPNKVGKDAALRAWTKKACEGLCNDILSGLERNMGHITREGGEFIPNPSTWLNQGRWKDEPPMAAPADRGNLDAAKAFLEGRFS
jgi:hypothetical protein